MVRGSEENCVNGNKLNQQQTKDEFLFCFDRSFPFDLDELTQFVKELVLGEPVSSVTAQAKTVESKKWSATPVGMGAGNAKALEPARRGPKACVGAS